MKKHLPESAKNLIKRAISCMTWDPWAGRSWSQEGEDQILLRIFAQQSSGFYVDVGAHHPKRFSNTYLFYRRGWSGINIDAMPGSMRLFHRWRPNDINLEFGIGNEKKQLDYYVFNEPALNSFSPELSLHRHDTQSADQIEKIIKVTVLPLSSVFDHYLPHGQEIDFMSIDVEGLDWEVLQSNDWSKYRPKFVLVEMLDSSLHDIENSAIARLMLDAGYALYAKCVNTVFFKNTNNKL
ncbi:SAM-dependent methyltransferase [Rhabdochromatium marinum]|nr:SAM-dependent methyltransferase [Rhabdochromatium marinum]